jgi:hypothetical protein
MSQVLHVALMATAILAACKQSAPSSGETTKPTAPASTPITTNASTPGDAAPTGSTSASASATSASRGASWSFDGDKLDAPPAGFSFGRTGSGKDGRWIIQSAADAPSGPNVLAQVEADATDSRFPIAVVDASSFTDVKVSVSCKPVSGAVDQACGLVWRYRDASNYYLARANALEDNVRIYHVKNGNRVQFASWSGRVATKVWHRLAVEAKGDRFVVSLDDKPILDARDTTFAEAGKVGVWTKADSVTQFDDLTVSTP